MYTTRQVGENSFTVASRTFWLFDCLKIRIRLEFLYQLFNFSYRSLDTLQDVSYQVVYEDQVGSPQKHLHDDLFFYVCSVFSCTRTYFYKSFYPFFRCITCRSWPLRLSRRPTPPKTSWRSCVKWLASKRETNVFRLENITNSSYTTFDWI